MKLQASSCRYQFSPFAASRELRLLLQPEGIQHDLDAS